MGKFVTPKVFLIAETIILETNMHAALDSLGAPNWSTDAIDSASGLTEFAGKLCYMSFDPSLNQNLTKTGGRNNHDYIQGGIIATGHGSVLEHSSVTFLLQDVTRIVTHELIRHRPGMAYSQTSGRYVRTDQIDMYLPNDIAKIPAAKDIFQRAMHQMELYARALADVTDVANKPFSLKKKLTSAFRRIIGNGQATNIVVTGNHRAWRHTVAMRTDPSAEEEIRVAFAEVSRQLRARYPAIYADAVITVVDDIEVTTFLHPKV